MAFLNFAREYFAAAECVSSHAKNLANPGYFLYFHTVELLFKAYLRAHGLPIMSTNRESHNLTELYEECRKLGLVVGTNDRFQIGNIVSLLEEGNEYQGFRYFHLKGAVIPELGWTREVVGELLKSVESHVEAFSKQGSSPGVAAKLVLMVGKPRPQ